MKTILISLLLLSGLSHAGPSRYDWGTEPVGVTLPVWPDAPAAATAVSVSNITEMNAAIALGNRLITVTANIPSQVTINTDDNLIDLNQFTIGGLLVDGPANRTEVRNGFITDSFDVAGTDTVIDNISATMGDTNGLVNGAINVAIINSDIETGDGFGIYMGEFSTNMIIANSRLEATAGNNAGLRMMGPQHVAIIDSNIVGFSNAPLRVHAGDLFTGYTLGGHDVWIARTQVQDNGLGGAFWFNRESGVAIEPTATLDRMVVEDNTIYNSGLEINTDVDPISLYTNLKFYRNTSYNFEETNEPRGAGGGAGYEFPLSGPNENVVNPIATPPAFTGGFGTGGSPPAVSANTVRFGGTIRAGVSFNVN